MEEQLGKYFSGEASEQEISEILRWRDESDQNASIFFETKSLWLGAQGPDQAVAPQDVLNKILGVEGSDSPAALEKVFPLWRVVSYAAVIALLLGFGWWFFLKPVPTGIRDEFLPMVETHQLKDGSTLRLYAGSSFSITAWNETRREVTLKGKGFFDVERDENRPFVVLTDNARVQVLGTSFVIDTKNEQSTEVLVASGKVSLAPQADDAGTELKELVLEKGDKGVLSTSNQMLQKAPIVDENFMAWSSGILSFNKQELGDVSDVLREVYGLDVKFGNEGVATCQLTAKFRRKKAEEVVRLIADTFDMKYRIEGNTVEFTGKGCQ